MRPIDADALIEKCGGWYVDECTESGFIGTLENLLATEPTIQPQSTTGQLNDGTQSTARSTDLIGRQAAIDAINSWRGRFSEEYNEAIDDCENSIKELPIIQPEPQWIPVSERLPETGGESFFDGMVLITLRDKETGDLYVLNDKYCGDGDWLMCVPDEPTKVIAWMPLPEAYKPNK